MASIYTAPKSCLKFDYRTYLANAFIESLNDSRNGLYLTLGRSAEWPSEIEPPSPTQSLEDEVNFRKALISFKKVQPNDISFVIPKRIWRYGEIYDKYNETDPDGKNTVVVQNMINGQRVYYVFLCVERPEDYSKPSILVPTYNKLDPVSYIYNSDGYDWVLLYELSENEYRKFSSDEWIAVPDAVRAGVLQNNIMENAYNRSIPPYNFYREDQINIPINGYGSDPIYQLKAYHFLISLFLSPKARKISTDFKFRQVGLWMNPVEKISGKKAKKDSYLASEIDLSTGNVLYFENRKPIPRDESQIENVKILLGC
jgi:hypothetical protein